MKLALIPARGGSKRIPRKNIRTFRGRPMMACSLEPAELVALVQETERAWQALGKVRYGPTEAELSSLQFRRSIYVAAEIAKGELFTPENLRVVRPGYGAPPHLYDQLLGRPARRAYQPGTPLSLDQLL